MIEKCRRQDASSMTALYKQTWSMIYPSVYFILRNKADAEDAMQEGYIKGFGKLEELRQPERYLSWQKSICIREALNRYKKDKKHLEWEKEERVVNSLNDEAVLDDWPVDEMLGELKKLPHGYQVVIQLHAMEGISHEEIGNQLGIAASTSRSQYSRAIMKLKQEMNVKR